MKKNILLILALQIAVSFIYGCAFEEQYVPDPKPAQNLIIHLLMKTIHILLLVNIWLMH